MVKNNSLGEIVAKATACIACAGGLFFHGAKLFAGRDSIPPITEHIGDFSLVGIPILFSNLIAGKVEELGKKYNSRVLEKIGHYAPEITAGLTTAYFTLGESVLPQILPGTADPKDIPAVLIAGLSFYYVYRNAYRKR